MKFVFEEHKCQGNLLKGYSGCMCDYCREYRALPGTWIVNTKGGIGKGGFEISVLRENNRHGQASYGWFGEDKILISHDYQRTAEMLQLVWERLLKVAHEVAEELNKLT